MIVRYGGTRWRYPGTLQRERTATADALLEVIVSADERSLCMELFCRWGDARLDPAPLTRAQSLALWDVT